MRVDEKGAQPANASSDESGQGNPIKHPAVLGDGGESGDILPGKSLVFATLEVCLCVLVRHIPNLNPSIPSTGFGTGQGKYAGLGEHACQLISAALLVMADLPQLCSPAGRLTVVLLWSLLSLLYVYPRFPRR